MPVTRQTNRVGPIASGIHGRIDWSYQPAADVCGFVVERLEGGVLYLRAAIRNANEYRLTRSPLTFIVTVEHGEWRWPVEDVLSFADNALIAVSVHRFRNAEVQADESAFVDPQVVRLPLSDNEWLDVKRELTFGEQEQMFANMRKQFGPGEIPILDTTRIGRSRMESFIVGWSFVDPSGKPVPFSTAAIQQLRPHVAKEIRDALELHEELVLQEREAEKNDQGGGKVSSPISPSAS